MTYEWNVFLDVKAIGIFSTNSIGKKNQQRCQKITEQHSVQERSIELHIYRAVEIKHG